MAQSIFTSIILVKYNTMKKYFLFTLLSILCSRSYSMPAIGWVSTTVTQNTNTIYKNTTNNHIIGMAILLSGTGTTTIDIVTCNTNGTTATSDISNAKLWYGGTSAVFSTATQYATTIASPSGSM